MAKDDSNFRAVDGDCQRKPDPDIPASLRSELETEVATARCTLDAAAFANDGRAVREAEARLYDALVALGELGREWWLAKDDGAIEGRLAAAIRALLRKRGADKTICPGEAARIAGGSDWRELMDRTRMVAWQLVADGWLEVTQSGEPIAPPVSGPIRLRRAQR